MCFDVRVARCDDERKQNKLRDQAQPFGGKLGWQSLLYFLHDSQLVVRWLVCHKFLIAVLVERFCRLGSASIS